MIETGIQTVEIIIGLGVQTIIIIGAVIKFTSRLSIVETHIMHIMHKLDMEDRQD